MVTVKFSKGAPIFNQGDRGSVMYFIESGKVAIYIGYGKPGEKLLVELGVGKYFGEMSLIEDLPRSATAIALEDSELTAISNDEFADFIQSKPIVARQIMTNLSGRLRAVTNDLMEACRAIAEDISEKEPEKKKTIRQKLKKFADMYVESARLTADYGYAEMPYSSFNYQHTNDFWMM